MSISTDTQERINAAAAEAYRLVKADMDEIKEQVRKVSEKLDRHMRANIAADAAALATKKAKLADK
jgi:hypothetical protein